MTKKLNYTTKKGSTHPLGSTFMEKENGTNFAIFSVHATKVELCIFDDTDKEVFRTELEKSNGHIWNVFVNDIKPLTRYGYRVYGAYAPLHGHKFNHHKLLIDPYAKALDRKFVIHHSMFAYNLDAEEKDLSFSTTDSADYMPKCLVMPNNMKASSSQLQIPLNETIIYETHVINSTAFLETDKDKTSPIEKIHDDKFLNHLVDMGMTSIELMPMMEYCNEKLLTVKGLENHWGYNTINFFAPTMKYMPDNVNDTETNTSAHIFKQMVDSINKKGIEVILDVVYNHTAEADHLGPTICYKGIDNAYYYHLNDHEPRYYKNFTGCGNALNLNQPIVLKMVLDSLRYYKEVLNVSGFRFDLTSTLLRDNQGGISYPNNFLSAVYQDPVLQSAKMIAEPWDVEHNGYQLSNMTGNWSEWNDQFRDVTRKFLRGDDYILPHFARILTGSSHLFAKSARTPQASINFITIHDGFTLKDLVSYNHKHNLANKENNNDGANDNLSYNYGVEGHTQDGRINSIRIKQQKNALCLVFLSMGVPMLRSGDEISSSHNGNNNVYCQNNELSWIKWDNLENDTKNNFTPLIKKLIQLRKEVKTFTQETFLTGDITYHNKKDIYWFNEDAEEFDDAMWHNPNRKLICIYYPQENQDDVFVAINLSQETIEVKLPQGFKGKLIIDTSEKHKLNEIYKSSIELENKTIVILKTKGLNM